MKQCRDCKDVKPLSEMKKDNRKPDGRDTICKECHGARARVTYHKDPERNRNTWLVKKFGITATEYDAMLEAQEGCCAICGIHEKHCDKRLAVDHNHDTGEVRALLCSPCNVGLGMFRENKEFLAKAIEYVEEHNEL